MLDLQHVPNIKDSKRLIRGFTTNKGVTIVIPSNEHKKIKCLDYSSIISARTLLAREVRNLKQCIGVPSIVLLKIIEANKERYSEAFKK